MNENRHCTKQLSSSFSIEALKEIVRNCKRNEQYLQELIYHTRHERRKVQRILHELYQTKQEHDKPISSSFTTNSKTRLPKSIQFFVPFIDTNKHENQCSFNKIDKKPILNESENRSSLPSILRQSIHSDASNIDNNHRVRFHIPENTNNSTSSYRQMSSATIDDQLSALARRCEDLLVRLDSYHHEKVTFKNSNSSSKQTSDVKFHHQDNTRYSHFNLQNENLSHDYNLKFDHKCQHTLPYCHSNLITNHTDQTNLTRIPMTYYEPIQQSSMKNYEHTLDSNERFRNRYY